MEEVICQSKSITRNVAGKMENALVASAVIPSVKVASRRVQ